MKLSVMTVDKQRAELDIMHELCKYRFEHLCHTSVAEACSDSKINHRTRNTVYVVSQFAFKIG